MARSPPLPSLLLLAAIVAAATAAPRGALALAPRAAALDHRQHRRSPAGWPFQPPSPPPPAPAPPAPPAPPPAPECMWLEYHMSPNISAWEFQLAPRRHVIRHREKAISRAERLLRALSKEPGSGVAFVEGSRWMTIYQETSYMATTWHGAPLHPERAPLDKKGRPKKHPFPWRGVGYLRRRWYRLTTPAGAVIPSAAVGSADLTFKMKKVDASRGVAPLALPEAAAGAALTAKVENDVHCNHTRETMSPLFRPVPRDLDVSTAGGDVARYFPNLAEVAYLDPQEPLPFMHTVHRAKIVWTVVFAGAVGEANLVIKYNTTFADAAAGRFPKNGELSLRIRREAAEQSGEAALRRALDAVARAAQAFRDDGWDEKTGAWRRPDGDDGDGGGDDDGDADGGGREVDWQDDEGEAAAEEDGADEERQQQQDEVARDSGSGAAARLEDSSAQV